MTANLTASTTRHPGLPGRGLPPARCHRDHEGVQRRLRPPAVQPGDGRDLVWSPTDRRTSCSPSSTAPPAACASTARRWATPRWWTRSSARPGAASTYGSAGKTVRRVRQRLARLARAGVRVSYYSDPGGFYIHGKVIEADYGTRHAKVFIGSENFSSTSLNRNRELGLIISGRRSCPRSPGPSPPTSATANTGPRPYRNRPRYRPGTRPGPSPGLPSPARAAGRGSGPAITERELAITVS